MHKLYQPPGARRLISCPREVSTCTKPSGVLDSIGNTPLVTLRAASEATGCRVFGKADYMNPGGSVKDRIAKAIIERAAARRDLRPATTIPAAPSRNSATALTTVG